MRTARKGTLISKQAIFEDDDDDFNNDTTQEDKLENIRLYDCGHAFHNHCILKLIQEKI